MDRAVFVDRDGVINSVVLRDRQPASPRSLAEFRIEPGIAEPLEQLRASGFRLFAVTNQPDIARGFLDFQTLGQFHRQVIARLPIEAIEVCPHDDRDCCQCRKPKPGMLMTLARREGVELAQSFVIGDSWRDVQAARAAGCVAIMLDRLYNRNDDTDYRVTGLGQAAALILDTLRR
ncbi:MAG: HAD-IIIA family hydrolase [Deltaproteobacteria bacterium]|nr:HAD-IIIA family hydrolase [Deltaproteobacteria bacterium]